MEKEIARQHTGWYSMPPRPTETIGGMKSSGANNNTITAII